MSRSVDDDKIEALGKVYALLLSLAPVTYAADADREEMEAPAWPIGPKPELSEQGKPPSGLLAEGAERRCGTHETKERTP